MSAQHKRPLVAFIVIALVCAFVVGRAVRAEAVERLIAVGVPAAVLAPVTSQGIPLPGDGLRVGSRHHRSQAVPAKPVTRREPVRAARQPVLAEPAVATTTRARHHHHHRATRAQHRPAPAHQVVRAAAPVTKTTAPVAAPVHRSSLLPSTSLSNARAISAASLARLVATSEVAVHPIRWVTPDTGRDHAMHWGGAGESGSSGRVDLRR